ncbi:MAG: hypothetical protein KIH64_000435, partial [Mycobacterium sp.]|nr:hypothetical protein [Mycobacterium sp.]
MDRNRIARGAAVTVALGVGWATALGAGVASADDGDTPSTRRSGAGADSAHEKRPVDEPRSRRKAQQHNTTARPAAAVERARPAATRQVEKVRDEVGPTLIAPIATPAALAEADAPMPAVAVAAPAPMIVPVQAAPPSAAVTTSNGLTTPPGTSARDGRRRAAVRRVAVTAADLSLIHI